VSVPVPPLADAVALPLLLPQLAALEVITGVEITVGSVMMSDVVVLQLLLSVIVTIYVFAGKELIELLRELVIEEVPLLQLYVYGEFPPLILTAAVPVLFPLQSSFTGVELCTLGPLLFPIATVFVITHAFASVTLTVYAAAERLAAVCPVAVLLQV